MSVINDALKKIEKDKQPFQQKPSQILSKIGNLKIETERYVLKRWLIWTGTGVACLLGVILAITSFKKPADEIAADSVAIHETILQDISHPREIDIKTPFKTANFNLSGIFYDSQKPMAIINDRILEEGSFINGAKLLEIQPNYVRLSLKGEELKLKIK